MIRLIASLFVFLLFPALVRAQEGTSWTLGFSGYIQQGYAGHDLNNDRTRLRFTLKDDANPCSAFAEADVATLQNDSSAWEKKNWLLRAEFNCVVGQTKLDFGRIFVKAGFTTFWPGAIITARYPGMYPWVGYYAYGVSAERGIGEWVLSGTLSGASNLKFDDSGQFDRVEFAGRAKRSLGDLGYYSFGVQASSEFFIGGVDFHHFVREKTCLDGGVWYTTEGDSPVSAFIQVEQTITQVIALHAFLEERPSGDEVATAGIGFRWRGFYLVGDYEKNFSTGDNAVLGGLRYNW